MADCQRCAGVVTGTKCRKLYRAFENFVKCDENYDYTYSTCNGYSCDSISGKKTCTGCL
ncbi:hypothetical protein CROQUDRAFT_659121, partial [Cronartium quercuum f. sp. fusiforme G11]